jgi:ubiquinone/menaquinone biosynthesis C-methylase UbiE
MDTKHHWESIYRAKAPAEVSWYQDYPAKSLEWIKTAAEKKESAIIDVGGGASTLVDHLVEDGYKHLWVLDISSAALERTKIRLGQNAELVHWTEGDITQTKLPHQRFDVWHDRAVFHFLTLEQDRQTYKKAVEAALKPNGHLIMATFALEGPPRCSGLKVVRYSPESLAKELGPNFQFIESGEENHVTPFGTSQRFIYCLFQYRP